LNNYCAVQEAFDLTVEEWVKIAKTSIECSWVDDDRKAVLWEAVLACKEEYGTKI